MANHNFLKMMYIHAFPCSEVFPCPVVFPCFFLRCKANARVKSAKMGHSPHSSKISVLFYVFFLLCSSVYCVCVYVCVCVCVCVCVLYYCHWVATHLQLTDISEYLMCHIRSNCICSVCKTWHSCALEDCVSLVRGNVLNNILASWKDRREPRVQ